MVKMDQNALNQAISLLAQSDVVAIPTETVYGLAARIDRPEGIDRIFTTKERPDFDPLIVHVAGIDQAKSCTLEWNEIAQKLAEAFWPGPLTLVLKKAPHINPKITSGLESVGLRCPNHPITLNLIKKTGPLAAPSANRFGKTSPTSALHVRHEFADKVFILDGGSCTIGIESTVVGVFNDHLEVYRPGMITPSMLAEASGVNTVVKESPVAPGALKHHYMPDVPMYLVNSPDTPAQLKTKKIAHITLNEDASIAARELYQVMREACQEKIEAIVLHQKMSQTGEKWDAVWNRVHKAITPLSSLG